ncbi:BON domain-containing protein [Tahibacter sp.]|uniref:BON domain-containing protein n=1 Tax=Tahibacter sp. TaxID=2056211 RepID=UPI0028C42452|nr:BON domain-containing protein [Tahibacter sp.]
MIEALEFEPSTDAESTGLAEEHATITSGDRVQSCSPVMAPERAAGPVRGVEEIAQNVGERIPCHERGVFNPLELAAHGHRDDIRQRIAGALVRRVKLEADRIGIAVDGTTVTISGTVDNWDDRFAVQRTVWSVSGVRDVVDQLQVA